MKAPIKMIKMLLLSLVLVLMACQPKAIEDSLKPNIILIISDDQAYTDYSFMGHPHISTPNIDQLAKESMSFTRGYATAPLCSPSLASIITGLYAQQHGITGNDPVVEYEGPKSYGKIASDGKFPEDSYPSRRNQAYQKLSANYYKNKLITHTLKASGYYSFQTGKWWVGSAEDAGFDRGMTHGDYTRGGRHGDEGLKIAREGLSPIYDFIEESQSLDKPFFIWHAPFLPHTPHNPPKELEEKYLELTDSPYVAKYYAMVEWFDQTVGELLNHLKEKNLEENTIILYTCDNGWIQSENARGYAPKSKRAPHEGGIRTPIMIKYPKEIKASVNHTELVSNIDIVPTLLNMIGVEAEDLPGINMLDRNQLEKRSVVFAEAYNHDILNVDVPAESILYKVAIEREWKLMIPNGDIIKESATTRKQNIQGYYSNEIQLYNLVKDPEELINVAEENPEIVARLSQSITEWWHPG